MKFKPVFCLILLLLFGISSFGQSISVANVAKIYLLTAGGGIEGNTYIEVAKDNNSWKSCFIKRNNGYKTDTTKRLIRNVADSVIANLVVLFNNRDAEPVVSHYGLDGTLLTKYADSIAVKFNPNQKKELIKALHSNAILKRALKEVAAPDNMDDRTYCSISIITTDGRKYEISASPFAYLDYMVWQGEQGNYYNPEIHRIFNYLRLKDKETAGAKSRLYINVVKTVYNQNFETKLNWAYFKETAPVSFKLMSQMFKPLKLYRNKNWLNGRYSFLRLPAYVNFGVGFNIDELEQINLIKRREDSIVNIFKKSHFLVKHFKSQPGATVTVNDENDGKHQYFRLAMPAANGNHSDWLVVDGKSIILVNYTGQLKDPFNDKFQGITPNSSPVAITKQCYLIYDMDGKLIGGDKPAGNSGLIFK